MSVAINRNEIAPPVEQVAVPPSSVSRLSCASAMAAIFACWAKWAFIGNENVPGNNDKRMHSVLYPATLTMSYLVSLPLLIMFTQKHLSKMVDVKLLLKETMIVYNGGQVILNLGTVWMIFYALHYNGHPFNGDVLNVTSGATYAVWIHYCNKYLEFFDTFFMVLRGKLDQVSFLHIYHHVSIAWAWYAALYLHPGGDAYFGALLNSIIHVLMYSYYTLALLKISCPWKKYLTFAQLVQFTTVLAYSFYSITILPPEAEWNHYIAICIQNFEMISLFVLFALFFMKTYGATKEKDVEEMPEASDSSSISENSSDSYLSSD